MQDTLKKTQEIYWEKIQESHDLDNKFDNFQSTLEEKFAKTNNLEVTGKEN